MNRIQRLEYLQELTAPPGAPEATLRPLKDLTFANAPGFEDAFIEYVKEGRTRLRLDMSGVELIDSGGVGALVKLRNVLEGAGGSLAILNPGKIVLNILRVVGLLGLVKHEHVASFAPAAPRGPGTATSNVFVRPSREQLAAAGGTLEVAAPPEEAGAPARVDALLETEGARVEVKENVTYLNAQGLLDGLLARLAKGVKHVRVDVAKVEIIDSAGVGVLLKAAKAFAGAGGDLTLVSPTTSLQRILKIVKLDRVLKIES